MCIQNLKPQRAHKGISGYASVHISSSSPVLRTNEKVQWDESAVGCYSECQGLHAFIIFLISSPSLQGEGDGSTCLNFTCRIISWPPFNKISGVLDLLCFSRPFQKPPEIWFKQLSSNVEKTCTWFMREKAMPLAWEFHYSSPYPSEPEIFSKIEALGLRLIP